MEAIQTDAMLQILQLQRNNAENQVVQLAGQIAVLENRIKELEEKSKQEEVT